MRYKKLRVSTETTKKLRYLQQRTQLTPNLLSRMALTLSLQEGSIVGSPTPADDGMEFNRYTLTGDLDAILVTLLAFVESDLDADDPANEDELVRRLRGHIARGMGNLAVRLKSPADIARLVVS